MTDITHRKPGRPTNEVVRHQREEEILDAAARLFAEYGFSDANTQVLADTLGVGKGTIYRYFPSKQELFLAAVDRAMRQLTDTIDRVLEDIDEPLVRMLAAMTAYLAFFAQHPEYVELIIQERAQFKDRKKPTYFVYRDANVVRWRAAFVALMAAGRVRDVPAERITNVLSDMLYGRMFTNYFVGSTRPPEEQASEIFDIAFYGVLSDSERTRVRPHT